MSNKNGKKASVAHSDTQKKDLLAKWDGTAAGAKALKVPTDRSRSGRRRLGEVRSQTKANDKAAKPGRRARSMMP